MAERTTSFLSGVRVLDLSIWRPGPYATSLLVALGADVLKVEPPGGDPMRHYRGLFEEINAGKRSMVLDLKAQADGDRVRELASVADVVVEGFRPGVVARLGLDDAVVRASNPGVVYCSISGYGQQDERAALPGHDVNYQAWSGALTPEGGVGAMPPLPTADLAAGTTAAFGICAALLGRTHTGTGAYLDVSMTDVLSTWTGRTGAEPGRAGREDTSVPGYGLFETIDGGQISLGVVNEDHFWSSLCHELSLDDLADLDFTERTRRGRSAQGGRPRHRRPPARGPGGRAGRGRRTGGSGAGPHGHAGGWPVPRLPNPDPGRSLAARAGPRPTPGGRVRGHPMTEFSDLLAANRGYAAARANVADPRPGRRLAVITCMDARIDVFAVLGLHLGEAHVIRNAGGRVTEDVLRSLALSSGVLGVDTAVVMQHTKCGLVGVTDAELRQMTGADLGFFPIDDHAAALREDVNLLARTPYLSRLVLIAGLIYDVESGEFEDVVHWERAS